MTPFMSSVESLLAGSPPPVPTPDCPPAAGRGVASVTDSHLAVRAVAEQLVSEANAVLAGHGRSIALVDEVGPGGLAFTLSEGGRSLRVDSRNEPQIGAAAVPALVLDLIADPTHPAPARHD